MNDRIPVLMVHNRYRCRGGEDLAFENDVDLLRSRGHQVTVYEQDNAGTDAMNRGRLAARTLWSRESARDIAALIVRDQPALMHVHNLSPLISPSIYYVAARYGVPVVQQLHNYRLICPNALLLRNDGICEECLAGSLYVPAIRHACYRESRLATATVAAMLILHRILRTWERKVTLYIAPSVFAQRKFLAHGFAARQTVVRANYLATDPGVAEGPRDGAVFVGMLQAWKGVPALLDAWRRIRSPEPLRIVGEGPGKPALQMAAKGMPNVQFLGALDPDGVYFQLRRSRFLVFPSIAYETFGRTLIEAFACATPVIASRLGAATDIVHDQETGLLFPPGDAAALARKIDEALSHPEDMRRMGRTARRVFESRYTADPAYLRLMEIYQQARSSTADPRR